MPNFCTVRLRTQLTCKDGQYVLAGTVTPKDSALHGAANDPFPHENDLIQIPYVALDVRESFKDLLKGNRRYYPGKPVPWEITAAEQYIRFKLHEKGAEIRVESTLAADPFAAEPEARNSAPSRV